MTAKDLKFRIAGEHDYFRRFYTLIDSAIASIGIPDSDRFRFAVCVSEAYTNAYLHGNLQDHQKGINLHFSWTDDQVRVVVEDEGEGRLSEINLATRLEDVSQEKSGGRGVAIMKQFADKMEVEERAEGGLRVILYFSSHKQT